MILNPYATPEARRGFLEEFYQRNREQLLTNWRGPIREAYLLVFNSNGLTKISSRLELDSLALSLDALRANTDRLRRMNAESVCDICCPI